MQQARDSGQSVSTAKHTYLSGTTVVPVILVFTPIYAPTLPSASIEQRRIALRGFVFSIYEIEEMIERVMGSNFHALFDLEIYDGGVRAENIRYDGDERPHVLLQDANMPIARSARVTVAGREWHLYFYPKPGYVDRFHSWHGGSVLALGFAISAALSAFVWRWTGRVRARVPAGRRWPALRRGVPKSPVGHVHARPEAAPPERQRTGAGGIQGQQGRVDRPVGRGICRPRHAGARHGAVRRNPARKFGVLRFRHHPRRRRASTSA